MALTTYDGGKNSEGVYHKIINQIPPHRRKFELFGGSGAITRRIRPAERNYFFDLSRRAVAEIKTAGVPNLVARQACGLSFLRSQAARAAWRPDDFIYIDAPYLFATRSQKAPLYEHEFGEPEQHVELLKASRAAASLGAMAAISHYPCELYESLLTGWRKVEYKVGLRGGRSRIEALYLSYDRPRELHDYNFLGRDFRHREKLNRRRVTISGRLDRMFDEDEQVLYSYLAAIDDWRSKRLAPGR